MIKTIIIDDNKIIREHFQKMIDWKSKGFELITVAGNGIAGWQAFEKYHPQLVITDVKMPGMNGLELAQKIKASAPEVMIVFISNYEDFNYLKTAMNIGAYDYILKHETRGKLFDEKLEKIKKEITDINLNKQYYSESILFSALISNDSQKLEHTFPEKYGMFLLEQTSILDAFSELTGIETDEINREEIKKLAYGYSDKVISITRMQKYRYAVLVDSELDIGNVASDLCSLLYEKTKTKFYSLIIGESITAKECCYNYSNYKDYLNIKFFENYKSVIRPEKYGNIINSGTSFDFKDLIDKITEMNTNKVCELLDDYTQKINYSLDYEGLKELSTCLLTFFMDNKYTNGADRFTFFGKDETKFWTNASEILFWLKNKSIQFINELKKNPVSSYSEPVRKAITYIQQHYMDNNLTVGEIAEAVESDMYRLNKAMKHETGLTMIKWLTNTRIEKAKILLENQEKIVDVCNATGYQNISYFSNVFKKICGETPIDYRKRKNDENSKNKKDKN